MVAPEMRVNPKNTLLTDSEAVRKYMQYFMQEIYRKQPGLTPEEEHLISFLGSGNDDAVLEELHKRWFSDEKRDGRSNHQGGIEKPVTLHSFPGLDSFTVAWVRHFWCDLNNLRVAAVNDYYDQRVLTRLLKPTTGLSPS
jgi:hypothetical protein